MSLYDINKNEVSLSIVNSNLLTNGYFRNLINQRGQTRYENTTNSFKYSVDRWAFRSVTNGKLSAVTVSANKVAFASTDTKAQFIQMFENNLPIGEYTLTLNVKKLAGDNPQYSIYVASPTNWHIIKISRSIGIQQIPINFDFEINGIIIEVVNQTSIEMEWIKLEQGAHFTGMPITDYVTELAKCMRYYQRYDNNNSTFATLLKYSSSDYTIEFPIIASLRTPYKFAYDKMSFFNNDRSYPISSIELYGNSKFAPHLTCTSTTEFNNGVLLNFQINGAYLEFDAEIY